MLPGTKRTTPRCLELDGVYVSENNDVSRDTRDIVFPRQQRVVPQIAVDIGGSLAKVVYFTPAPDADDGGRLNFVKFETAKIDDCIAFIKSIIQQDLSTVPLASFHATVEVPQIDVLPKVAVVPTMQAKQPAIKTPVKRLLKATGGGSYKYYDLISQSLGVTIEKEDEMECLVRGLNFLVNEIPYEVFSYSVTTGSNDPMVFKEIPENPYPYMLVNIGSGVSLLKVTGDDQFERVSGTSLGGGTFWGLLSLITGGTSFDDMLDQSEGGDNATVDMLVGDIYGKDYSKIGLKSSTIASSFGKVFKRSPEERQNLPHKDICTSLLYMLSNNIGQIAYLTAQAHGLKRIYFGGYFIRGHPITMNTLSYAINYWSKGTTEALFLRHEGYLGAVGAFFKYDEQIMSPVSMRYSFRENFKRTVS